MPLKERTHWGDLQFRILRCGEEHRLPSFAQPQGYGAPRKSLPYSELLVLVISHFWNVFFCDGADAVADGVAGEARAQEAALHGCYAALI
jgi:hypothetical protein